MKNIAQMIKIQIITTLNKDNVVHHIKILFNKKPEAWSTKKINEVL